MAKKRGWHNPAKKLPKTKEGSCPFCKKHVKNLADHKKRMHRGEKLVRKIK